MFLRFSHAELNDTLHTVKRLLDGACIPFVLLKGQGCATYYKTPELRDCGDIDIYVGEKNYAEACRLLQAEAGKTEKIETAKHLGIDFGDIPVEVHKFCDNMPTRRGDALFQKYAAGGLNSDLVPVEIAGLSVNTPSDTFNALYLLVHFFNHFMGGGIGFRQICDWTMFLHSRIKHIDIDKLCSMLNTLHLKKVWQVFGCISVDTLGLPVEEMPFYCPKKRRKARMVIKLIFELGNFGKIYKSSRNPNDGIWLRKIKSFLHASIHYLRILPIFPRYAVIAYVNMLCKVK
ncbi:MAG: nucleotidyltransferase family protein [Bacteroidales bacterium]|nr:nucleotidyltransferase family protein [Bacteroidales bacterium]